MPFSQVIRIVYVYAKFLYCSSILYWTCIKMCKNVATPTDAYITSIVQLVFKMKGWRVSQRNKKLAQLA